jgi:regulator of RNase E activity RraA
MSWTDDSELFSQARRLLFTAVVGDIMDTLALRAQFLPPHIQPLDPEMVVIGRAMPVLEADLGGTPPPKPFGLMLDALDDLKAGEVYVCTGASPTYALWGELMSMRAQRLGAAGVVLDGCSRDTRGILKLGFPTFSSARYAQDQAPRGYVTDFRIPIRVGAAQIEPGDILFGDLDGVCVIPRSAEREVFTKAFEKVQAEKTVASDLQSGLSARAAFEKHGIL